MFVSDEHGYISGELFVTDDGYQLALMFPDRLSSTTASFAVYENGFSREVVTVRPGETAVLHISNPSTQTVRVQIQNRRKSATNVEYRLDEIDQVSDGLRLSAYTATEIVR